jgi:hypothetical protein
MKRLISSILAGAFMMAAASASAAEEIIFIPHDDRPVSCAQTADTVNKLDGYNVIVPPQELLGGRDRTGNPDGLWAWLEENSRSADAVVLSSDALLYGSLVNSRKHDIDSAVILERAERFKKFRAENPNMKVYVFGSVMRTPRMAGSEEPAYYAKYGADIFRLTALYDKRDTEKLSRREKKELAELEEKIPSDALKDWLGRREGNFAANEFLISEARDNSFNYLLIGRDDNAPYSQTHKESRLLKIEAADLAKSKFQIVAGIDEIGLILLTRAVNDLSWQVPLVNVVYADGTGRDTVPTYSDERIEDSVRQHLTAAGGIVVPTAKNADLVLVVNTRYDGKTSEANWPDNNLPLTENAAKVAAAAEKYLSDGKKVAIADITFGNGADNAFMQKLAADNVLPRLTSYAGWNTATNSTGFALGQGILALSMSEKNKNDLLRVRYLDDWAYQANVRQSAAALLNGRTDGSYMQLDGAKDDITAAADKAMNEFAKENLSSMEISAVSIDFPWNRMFEANVSIATTEKEKEK